MAMFITIQQSMSAKNKSHIEKHTKNTAESSEKMPQTYIRSENADPSWFATLTTILKVECHLIAVNLKL